MESIECILDLNLDLITELNPANCFLASLIKWQDSSYYIACGKNLRYFQHTLKMQCKIVIRSQVSLVKNISE